MQMHPLPVIGGGGPRWQRLLQLVKPSRLARVFIGLYLCVSIIYTTNIALTPLLRALFGRVSAAVDFGHFISRDTLGLLTGWAASGDSPSEDSDLENRMQRQRQRTLDLYSDVLIYWDSPSGPTLSPKSVGNMRLMESQSTKASLFLSKAFAVSEEHLAYGDQSNLEVVPYYYRARTKHDKNDITITTLVTRNRFAVFKQLVERYQGPISVTIHVARSELPSSPFSSTTSNHDNNNEGKKGNENKNGNDNRGKQDTFLNALDALYTSTPLMARFVDVHLVLTPSAGDRQFNTWRNVARMFARTDYVMLLDVDFVPCTDFRRRVRGLKGGEVRRRLRNGDAALVVPAFEYVRHEDGLDAETFPKDKESLVALYNASRITMFHAAWAPGHNSTDYARFLFHSKPGEVYKVANEAYHHAYEPYVIFRREGPGAGVPWCDERFVGYGGNKAACLYEMYMSGVSFYVLSDDFLVHQSHAYDEAARKAERRYNRKIYADFREEICLKYLKAFLDTGTLGTPKAQNVREECKKIKGAAKIAAALLEGKLGIERDEEDGRLKF